MLFWMIAKCRKEEHDDNESSNLHEKLSPLRLTKKYLYGDQEKKTMLMKARSWIDFSTLGSSPWTNIRPRGNYTCNSRRQLWSTYRWSINYSESASRVFSSNSKSYWNSTCWGANIWYTAISWRNQKIQKMVRESSSREYPQRSIWYSQNQKINMQSNC